jgi:hypothetical protein
MIVGQDIQTRQSLSRSAVPWGAITAEVAVNLGGGMIPAWDVIALIRELPISSRHHRSETRLGRQRNRSRRYRSSGTSCRRTCPKHLTDRELDLLIATAVEEAKRRGRAPPIARADESAPRRSLRTDHRRQGEVAALSLTRGQINAVRAAFKAGIKASLIARQFGISQSDVRKVLASDEER